MGAKPKRPRLMSPGMREAWLRDDGSFERKRDAGLRTIAKNREAEALRKAQIAKEEAERKRQTNEDIIPPTPDDVVEKIVRPKQTPPVAARVPPEPVLEPFPSLDELDQAYDELTRPTRQQRVREAIALQEARHEIHIDPQTGAIESLLEDD